MNALKVGHARVDRRWDFALEIRVRRLEDEADRVIDRRIAIRLRVATRRCPWAANRSARDPVPGLLKARNVVVPPKAAATESWKKRSGSLVSCDARVGVDIDNARQHEQAGGIDLVRVGVRGQLRFDGDDAAAGDRDVGGAPAVGRHDRASTDDQLGHAYRSTKSRQAARGSSSSISSRNGMS